MIPHKQYTRTSSHRHGWSTGFGQASETGASYWSPQPSALRRDNLMEQQGSWLSVTPWEQDASRMRSTLRSDAEKAKSQKKTSLKKGGSRLLVGRVSSCPFREDTLLTKPFWLMRNFVQDTSCHLLAQHKTRPCSDKEMANS